MEKNLYINITCVHANIWKIGNKSITKYTVLRKRVEPKRKPADNRLKPGRQEEPREQYKFLCFVDDGRRTCAALMAKKYRRSEWFDLVVNRGLAELEEHPNEIRVYKEETAHVRREYILISAILKGQRNKESSVHFTVESVCDVIMIIMQTFSLALFGAAPGVRALPMIWGTVTSSVMTQTWAADHMYTVSWWRIIVSCTTIVAPIKSWDELAVKQSSSSWSSFRSEDNTLLS